MRFKKAIAMLLVLCMAIGMLTACGGSSKDTTTSDSTTTATSEQTTTTNETTKSEETQEPVEEDPFPGADLGGVTIKVWGLQNPETADEAKKEMWEERRKYVEEKFNCKLQYDVLEGVEWNDVPQAIVTSLASGDPIMDIGDMSRYWIGELVTNDAILDITDTVLAYNLPEPYWKGGCQWGDAIVGFNRNPIFPWSIFVYNRELIKSVGMAKTPGEMFKEGKWSFNDFYDYLKELKSKLPEGVEAFGIHALNWARVGAYGNGAEILNPETYVPSYTSDAFYEAIEFFQKLVQEGLAVNCVQEPREDGTIRYNWNYAQQGFTDGKLAITMAAEWDLEGYASQMDYGVVPPPWGPRVTIQNNDYTTLSDNYTSYYNDCGVFVIVKGAEKKATPKQYMDLIFSYFQDEAENLLKNREKVARGEKIMPSNAGTPRSFLTDLDIELWDWYISRPKFEPTDTTVQTNVFFLALYEVCGTNRNVRSAFEAVIGEDTYKLVEAGLVDESKLSPELKQKVEEYAATAAPGE